jgi:hypothetical protein
MKTLALVGVLCGVTAGTIAIFGPLDRWVQVAWPFIAACWALGAYFAERRRDA